MLAQRLAPGPRTGTRSDRDARQPIDLRSLSSLTILDWRQAPMASCGTLRLVAALLTGTTPLLAQATGVRAGPPAHPPLTPIEPVPGYDVTRDSAQQGSRESLLAAPIPFYNSQLEAGAVLVAGGLKAFGPSATTPPSFIGLIGLATTNGSWGAGLGGRIYTRDDAWRLQAGAMLLDVRLQFYGIGERGDQSVTLREEVLPFLLQGTRRVAPGIYLGLRGQYSTATVTVLDSIPAGFPPANYDDRSYHQLALAPVFQLDSRDDQMYPTRGWLVDLTALFMSDQLGSDSTMQNYTSLITWTHGWGDQANVLTAEFLGCYSSGQVPFDQLCLVGARNGLRGYEPARYLDYTQVTVQAEYRRKLGRFGLAVFGGVAQTAATPGDLSTDDLLPAAGAGIRYQLLKQYPLHYRVDVAFGRDGAQLYFSLGEAF